MNLDEAIALVKKCDNVEEVMQEAPQLLEFLNELNRSGTDIIRSMGERRALGAIEFIKLGALTLLLQEAYESGNMQGLIEVMSMSQSKFFEHAVIIIAKAAIGLAALEELR